MVKVHTCQRDIVPETVSTEEITVLGHQLIICDHKCQMKVVVVLNIKVVYCPYPSITLAFDASMVFELCKKFRLRAILFIGNK